MKLSEGRSAGGTLLMRLALLSAASPFGLAEDESCTRAEGAVAHGPTLLQVGTQNSRSGELQHDDAATFESARPGSCCSLDATTQWSWSMHREQYQDNISQGLPVVVECGHELTIDQSIAETLPGLIVKGSVRFQDGNGDIHLSTSYIFVCGRFSIGRNAPHEARVEIVLTGGEEVTWAMPGGDVKSFGTGGFITYGGDVYIRGAACEAPAWTRLAETVQPAAVSQAASLLSVASVQKSSQEEVGNIALGRPTKQSSTGHHRYTSAKAVDGKFNWKGSTSMTRKELNPWWYVQVPSSAKIGVVTLSERSHRGKDLSSAIVGVTDIPCETGVLCGGTTCPHALTRSKREDFDCGGVSGSYVYVQVAGTSATLMLEEVEVYSALASVMELRLQGAVHMAWQAGDQLIVASSSGDAEQTEEATIEEISAAGVKASGTFAFEHAGCEGGECVMAAEVASLSRNIVIRGAEGCDPVCGHFMLAHTPHGFVCGAEFTNLGQTAKEGRYPLHVHMPGEAPEIVLKGNSLHHNINRGLVLHGVHNATAESNLCFRTKGHCFMTEDGVEQHNIFRSNMGVLPSALDFGCSATHGNMTCPHRSDTGPNPFWISNPNNIFIYNVGIATGVAFNFETRHVMGLTARKFSTEAKKIGAGGKIKGRVPLGEFRGNLAHSSGMALNNYPRMKFPPGGKNVYEDFTAWRCGVGMSFHSSPDFTMPFVRARLYENSVGMRGGLSTARISVIESKITAKNSGSRPIIIHKVGTMDVNKLPTVFTIDSYSRNWVRCHGGYADGDYMAMFKDSAYLEDCPAE